VLPVELFLSHEDDELPSLFRFSNDELKAQAISRNKLFSDFGLDNFLEGEDREDFVMMES